MLDPKVMKLILTAMLDMHEYAIYDNTEGYFEETVAGDMQLFMCRSFGNTLRREGFIVDTGTT